MNIENAFKFDETETSIDFPSKKQLMRKTKKELIEMIQFKKQLSENNIEIYHGERQLLSQPASKDWKSFTISCYVKGGMIDEVCIWSEHMIDKWKNKDRFFVKLKKLLGLFD